MTAGGFAVETSISALFAAEGSICTPAGVGADVGDDGGGDADEDDYNAGNLEGEDALRSVEHEMVGVGTGRR